MYTDKQNILPTRVLIAIHAKVRYHTCLYNRLPEDEPLGSKLVEKNPKNENINVEKVHFFGMYCIII
jgi:hypothetical protein